MNTFSTIMMIWGCAAAMVSCVQAAPALAGQRLVLELPAGVLCYDFPQGHVQQRTVENRACSHSYDADSGEFYEESRVLGDSVRDGYGYTRWRLDFATPTTGTATLIKKHPRALRTMRVGDTVTFKTEPLPVPEVKITGYISGKTAQLSAEKATVLCRVLLALYAESAERELPPAAIPSLSADGRLTPPATCESPLWDIDAGEDSWTIARGLREDEALLLSHGAEPYRVPNQSRMHRLLQMIETSVAPEK